MRHLAGGKVIEDDDLFDAWILQQRADEVAADKPGASGNENAPPAGRLTFSRRPFVCRSVRGYHIRRSKRKWLARTEEYLLVLLALSTSRLYISPEHVVVV
jgi:hypothetical protein